jgi:hypothetical protein
MIYKQLNLKKMENQTINQTVESNEALSPQAETTKKQWVKPEMSVMEILNIKPGTGIDGGFPVAS